MSKLFQLYGVGQALFPVLPPPQHFITPPTINQTNYEIGQIVFSGTVGAYTFYIYAGAGVWEVLDVAAGNIISINGTTNQITVTTVAGVATVSLPAAITTPGSLTTTTSLSATTTITAGTGITSTTGNIVASAGNVSASGTVTGGTGVTATTGNLTATAGNLALNGVGSKVVINVAAPSTSSVGTSVAMTAGSVTVSTTAVSASSKIFLSANTAGGTPGVLNAPTGSITPGVSFVINSSSGTDTSTVNYWIVN